MNTALDGGKRSGAGHSERLLLLLMVMIAVLWWLAVMSTQK